MNRSLLSALILFSAFLAAPAMAQISVARSPTGTAPALGMVVRGSAASTFSISTAGVVSRTSGNAIRLSSASVSAPQITIRCGMMLASCSSRDVSVSITASGASGRGSISRFRVAGLSGTSYRNSAPVEAASLAFDLRPIGFGGSASFNLGMDVLLAAGGGGTTDTFTYTVTVAFR